MSSSHPTQTSYHLPSARNPLATGHTFTVQCYTRILFHGNPNSGSRKSNTNQYKSLLKKTLIPKSSRMISTSCTLSSLFIYPKKGLCTAVWESGIFVGLGLGFCQCIFLVFVWLLSWDGDIYFFVSPFLMFYLFAISQGKNTSTSSISLQHLQLSLTPITSISRSYPSSKIHINK